MILGSEEWIKWQLNQKDMAWVKAVGNETEQAQFLREQAFRDSAAWLNLDRGPDLFNIAVAFVILETLSISLYVYSRLLSKTIKQWDFWLMLLAFVFNMGLITAIFG